jgi:biofilm protein TabA
MLAASLPHPSHWHPFLTHPVLRRSLEWITAQAGQFPEGIHELGEPGWFVNVHGYTTQDRDLCTWENHRETIDLQYLIAGTESIDVAPVATLGQPVTFKAESDTEKFAPATPLATTVVLQPGDFVFFFPGEAHRPKIAAGPAGPLRKLVVKIPVRLLAGPAVG